jgi:hypothetical protein
MFSTTVRVGCAFKDGLYLCKDGLLIIAFEHPLAPLDAVNINF